MTKNSLLTAASEKIGNLIRSGNISEAEKELSLIPKDELNYIRMSHHYKGKIELVKGNYKDAITNINECITENGPHILLFSDLVAAYFLDRQYTKWRLTLQDLEAELNKCKDQLHEINRLRAETILAKAFELNGEIVKSYRFFQNMMNSKEINFRIKALLNLVRLEAQYPLGINFLEHYTTLKNYSHQLEVPDSDYDVLHSLILAEGEHIDFELALNNLSLIPQSQKCYFTLGYYELLDLGLRKNENTFELLQQKFGIVEPQSVSDDLFLKILQNKSVSLEWKAWPSLIPISQYFRLLRFILTQLPERDRQICWQQAQLMLKSLSSESQKIWISFFHQDGLASLMEMETKTEISYNSNGKLNINDTVIDFSKQKIISQLLNILINEFQGSINLSLLSQRLWNAELDNSYYDRIRQIIRRVNKATLLVKHCQILKLENDKLTVFYYIKSQNSEVG